MHGELGPNPHEDSLTSDTCYMMPCKLPDQNARIDSKPDTSAFMRDRSQVPYAKVLTQYDCTKSFPYAKVLTKCDSTKLDQIFLRGVGRNIREASRPKCTRDENFARLPVRLVLAQNTI